MTYAKKECNDCGIILPRNHLYSYQETINSGRIGHGSSIRFGSGRKPTFGLSSSRKFYKNRTIFLCEDCYQSRISGDGILYNLAQLAFGILGFYLMFWHILPWILFS